MQQAFEEAVLLLVLGLTLPVTTSEHTAVSDTNNDPINSYS